MNFSHLPEDAPGLAGAAGQQAGDDAVRHSPAALGRQETAGTGLPYSPSWVDRLTDWVRGLPVPSWLFYLLLGLALSLIYLALIVSSPQWANGSISPDTLATYTLLNGTTSVYLLALMHYLDNSAGSALARFRPVLTTGEAGYRELSYRLTTLPARSARIATSIGVIYTLATLLMTVFAYGFDSNGVSLAVAVTIWVFNLMNYSVAAVTVYHSLHQLRMVNAIYTKHTRINVFQLGPLYALSGLTARTALGIGIPTYIWFQVNSLSSMGTTTSDIIQTAILAVVIVAAFIGPLLGAHNLLEREKQRLQDEVGRRMDATIAALHSRADTGELNDFGALKGVLDGLVAEQGVIDKLRTWPWRTETVRGIGLAFFLPVVIWIVQRILERIGV